MADKYKKSVAQIVLRWGIQRDTIVIPELLSVERLRENFDVFNFELTEEDLGIVKGVDRKHGTNHPTKTLGLDPNVYLNSYWNLGATSPILCLLIYVFEKKKIRVTYAIPS